MLTRVFSVDVLSRRDISSGILSLGLRAQLSWKKTGTLHAAAAVVTAQFGACAEAPLAFIVRDLHCTLTITRMGLRQTSPTLSKECVSSSSFKHFFSSLFVLLLIIPRNRKSTLRSSADVLTHGSN